MPVIPFAVPLIALMAFLFLLAANAAWRTSFGYLLQYLADQFDAVRIRVLGRTIVGLGFIASAFRTVDHTVQRIIGAAITFTAAPFVTLLTYLAVLFERPALELADLTADLAHTLGQLRKTIVPAMIAAKVGAVWRHIAALEARVQSIAARAPVHVVERIAHTVKPSIVTIVRKAVAVPLPRIGRLERDAAHVWDRLRRLGARVTPAALVAPIAVALGALGLGWLRCSRVKSLGKQACASDSDLLDSLIAGSFLVVGSMSLLEFVEAMQDSMGAIEPQVTRFWRA